MDEPKDEPMIVRGPERAVPRRGSRAWWLVLAGRVLLLAVAAAGSTFAFLRAGPDRAGPTAGAVDRYRCPMHPGVSAPVPGACPICGMALVHGAGAGPVAAADGPELARVERRVLSDEVRAPAWVDAGGVVVAMLQGDDVIGLVPGDAARFASAAAPSVDVALVLAAAPPAPPGPRDGARLVRFLPAGGGAALRPGDEGLLVIAARPCELVVVPSSAILQRAEGSYVFAFDRVDHHFVRRAVRIGRAHRGVTAVVSGLDGGEQVAATDAFFLDAERRLGSEAAP